MAEVATSHGAWSFMIGYSSLRYEGEFILSKNDGDLEEKRVKHGKGIMTWQDGREYRGHFSYDSMHGEGVMTWPNGTTYVGEYCDNAKGGIGTLTYQDGSSFEGNWYKGKRHGEFLVTSSAGQPYRIEYESDMVVRTEPISSSCCSGWTFKPGYDVYVKSEGGTDTEGEEITCCICLGDLSNGETCCRMPCNHEFHKECIDNWTRRRNQCPLCLRKIPAHKMCSRESRSRSPSLCEQIHAR